MSTSKIIRWSLYGIGGLLAALLLVILLLALLRIPIDLSAHKQLVESTAGLALGRSVKVDDRIVITTSLRPVFVLEGVRIENPPEFGPGVFLTMHTARLQLKLLPLLMWKVHIDEIRVKGLEVDLAVNREGAVNWAPRKVAAGAESAAAPDKDEPQERSQLELTSDSLVLAELMLEDITVSYRSPDVSEPLQFKLDNCSGRMVPGQPFTLSMRGVFLKEPFTAEVKIGSLQELLETATSWMEIRSDIAKTRFDLSGKLNLARAARSLNLTAAVSGERLDNLDGLLGLDLPPLQSYRTAADVTMRKNHIALNELTIRVGDSRLKGTMALEKTGSRLKSSLDLHAPLIQLDDFDFGDWSPEPASPAKSEPERKTPQDAAEGGRLRELLSPEVLGKLDVRMGVRADQVISGADVLGSGSLAATIRDGRFSVDPVRLNIPGGAFTLSASLKPDPKVPEASLQAVMKNFDFGVLVRRVNPKAVMGGQINLDVDLRSKADSFEQLMANGNGYFDYSGRLENIKAGIIDLWAVNLIAAVLAREDDSKINCVIGRWTLQDGVLTPDVFMIDTSRIRICGRGSADFKNDRIELKVASRPKRPEFFNLATPIEVKGRLSDFGIGITTGGLVGTVVKFVTSPLHVPLRRLAGEGLPADGNDVCDMPIGADNRSGKPPPGCR